MMVREQIDEFFKGIHTYFYGNSNSIGLFSGVSFNQILLYVFIGFIIYLIILSVLKEHPGQRLIANFVISMFIYACAKFLYPGKEIMLVSSAAVFLTTIISAYYFLMWLPIRFKYDPQAAEKIQALMVKGTLTEEDNNTLVILREQTKEAYDNNVKWLFKPRTVKTDKYQ